MCVRACLHVCACVGVCVCLQVATPTRSQQSLVVQGDTPDPGLVHSGVVEGAGAVPASAILAKRDVISDVVDLKPMMFGALAMTRVCDVMIAARMAEYVCVCVRARVRACV